MGKFGDAVDALTKYLDEDPKTPDRTTIETRIVNLKKRIAAAPAAPIPPSATATPPPPPSSAMTAPAPPPASPPAEATKGVNRAPAFVAFGLGGAAAIGAVITGLVAKGKYDDAEATCKPTCSDDIVGSIRTTALVSDILTGVAVASVGVGAILFLTAGPSATDSAARPTPSFSGGLGPRGGRIEATWRF
jgi:hypothetical protein